MKLYKGILIILLISFSFILSETNNYQWTKWDKLINKKSFKKNWIKKGGSGQFYFKGNVLNGVSSSRKSYNAFLCSEKNYKNFELTCEFLIDHTNFNSGIQVRAKFKKYKNYKERVWGPQVEIDPKVRGWSGGIYEEAGRKWLYKVDQDKHKEVRDSFKLNAWNKMRILFVDDRIQTWINGHVVADYQDSEMNKNGFIAFQVHGTKGGEVYNVKWKKLKIRETIQSLENN